MTGYVLLGFFVTVFTLGICLPWSYTMLYNWEIKHTVINGHDDESGAVTEEGSTIGCYIENGCLFTDVTGHD
ncbi:MAG: hypothetical protein K5886_05920 [Lachnospiraceae bacterium]|nr:hypothetical protein [Lachnospiraceae bacterium]